MNFELMKDSKGNQLWRRNIKHKKCKSELKQQQQMSVEASHLAMMATRHNKVWALQPFNANIIRKNQEASFVEEGQLCFNSSAQVRERTEHCLYRNAKLNNNPLWSRLQVNKNLQRIMNPQEQHINKSVTRQSIHSKSYQDILMDEHISEFCKAKEEEQALKKRIQSLFVQKYPNRIETGDNAHYGERMARKGDKSTIQVFEASRKVNSRYSNQRSTYFYSKSKNKCMMEHYISVEHKQKQKQVMSTSTFIKYLSDRNVKKSFKQPNRKSWYQDLGKQKDNTIDIDVENSGLKRQRRLKKCLDTIIVDRILK